MFDVYLALGDSMSIDFYPAEDAKKALVSQNDRIGSSSLFYENDSELFPEFKGNDLSAHFPGIRLSNLAVDGATCDDLIDGGQKKAITQVAGKNCLISLTLGGNDLLHAFRLAKPGDSKALDAECVNIANRYESIVQAIKKKLPGCVLILTSVYDPTDGTGILPTTSPLYLTKLPTEYLTAFNNQISRLAKSHHVLFADVHSHFCGHGAEASAAKNFWYWKPSPIEPSYIGASEIRRVWLKTLADAKFI